MESPLLREVLFAPLEQKFQEIVLADRALRPICHQMMLPINLLVLLHGQSNRSLANDSPAMERMRLLLSSAGSHAIPAVASSALAPGKNASGRKRSKQAVTLSAENKSKDYAPGLLHFGELVRVGLAAGRVGTSLDLANNLVATVHGLALATGPAEAIARGIELGLKVEELTVLMRSLGTPGVADRQTSTLAATISGFLTEPGQRARWACLESIFNEILRDVESTVWDADLIAYPNSLEPSNACPGTQMEVCGNYSSELIARLKKKSALVAFAGPDQVITTPAVKITRDANGSTYRMTVTVPANAQAGWIGIEDPESRKRTNESRRQLQEAWTKRNASVCLRDTPVPDDLVPLLSGPALPHQTSKNRFEGGKPRVTAKLEPDVYELGQTLQLTWRTSQAKLVRLEPDHQRLESEGSKAVASKNDLVTSYKVIAFNSCGESDLELRARCRLRWCKDEPIVDPAIPLSGEQVSLCALFQPKIDGTRADLLFTGSNDPLAGTLVDGAAKFVIPAQKLGGTATLRLFAPDQNSPDDTRQIKLPEAQAERSLCVVLIRPVERLKNNELARVGVEEGGKGLRGEGRKAGLAVTVVDAFWVPDEALLTPKIDHAGSPGIEHLLEIMSDLAIQHPGLENALWLALIPGSATVAHQVPAEAAQRVAVASLSGIGSLLQAYASDYPVNRLNVQNNAEPSLVVRLSGKLGPGGRVDLNPLREERRLRGPGASIDTGMVALIRDAHGRELSSVPIRTVSSAAWPTFAALMPSSDEAVSLELRSKGGLLAQVFRDAKKPQIPRARVDDDAVLRWGYRHDAGISPHGWIEMQVHERWAPIAQFGRCTRDFTPRPNRLAAPNSVNRQRSLKLRVVASDGWNVQEAESASPLLINAPRLVLRTGPGFAWADTDDHADVQWTFNNQTRQAPIFVFPQNAQGVLRLSLLNGEYEETLELGEKA